MFLISFMTRSIIFTAKVNLLCYVFFVTYFKLRIFSYFQFICFWLIKFSDLLKLIPKTKYIWLVVLNFLLKILCKSTDMNVSSSHWIWKKLIYIYLIFKILDINIFEYLISYIWYFKINVSPLSLFMRDKWAKFFRSSISFINTNLLNWMIYSKLNHALVQCRTLKWYRDFRN